MRVGQRGSKSMEVRYRETAALWRLEAFGPRGTWSSSDGNAYRRREHTTWRIGLCNSARRALPGFEEDRTLDLLKFSWPNLLKINDLVILSCWGIRPKGIRTIDPSLTKLA